jgi:sugar phosphate isomerase/epimerase
MFDVAFCFEINDWDGDFLRLKPLDDMRRHLDLLGECGVKYVMTGGMHLCEDVDFDLHEGSLVIRELLDEYDMEITQHHSIIASYAPLDMGQDKVLEEFQMLAEQTAALRPNVVTFHLGRCFGKVTQTCDLYRAYYAEKCKHGDDALRQVIVGNLRVMGKIATENGFQLALENLGMFEPYSSLELLPAIVSAVDHPAVGYCVDSGHANVFGEDTAAWIKLAGDKLFAVHFHDNHGNRSGINEYGLVYSSPATDEHLLPGDGTIEWPSVIAALREVGFKKPITFELKSGMTDTVEDINNLILKWREMENAQ